MVSPTTMRLVDDTTGIELPIELGVGGIASPIKCVSYDLGFPDVREVAQDIPSQSGQNDDTEWFGGRTATLNLTVKDGTLAGFGTLSRHQWIDKLRALARPSLRPWLYIRCEGWAQERRMRLRANAYSCTVDDKGKVKIPVTLTYRVPSGTMQAVTATTGTIYPLAATSGLAFPISWDSTGVSFAPGASPNTAILTNDGTETAYGLFRVYGRGSNPILTNKTTGAVVVLTTPVASGHYVDINMADRTVYLDSDPSLSLYGALDLTRSTWWGLQPGANEVAFTIGLIDNSCQVAYEYTSEWI
jgi:hypothetical protein